MTKTHSTFIIFAVVTLPKGEQGISKKHPESKCINK